MSSDTFDKMIAEHDQVALLKDLPDEGLVAGDTGVVVYVYENAAAYEVEFPNPGGKPRLLVVTVEAANLLKLQPQSRTKQLPA